jgi:hypothetical protein
MKLQGLLKYSEGKGSALPSASYVIARERSYLARGVARCAGCLCFAAWPAVEQTIHISSHTEMYEARHKDTCTAKDVEQVVDF